jgi:hypothetical protein
MLYSYFFAAFEVLAAVVMRTYVFRDEAPCSALEINRHFRGTYILLQGRTRSQARSLSEKRWQVAVLATCHRVCCLDSWYPKMEATCSPETSIEFQLTTRHYILESRITDIDLFS